MEIFLADADATARLGGKLASTLRAGDAVLLSGPLGAGKTTLARALIRAVAGDPGLDVPSPSYALAQRYDTPRFAIHHLDLWRVGAEDALTELGWGQLDGVLLVEWPERALAAMPSDALAIHLAPEGESRRAALSGWNGPRLAALAR